MANLISILQKMRQAAAQNPMTAAPPVHFPAGDNVPLHPADAAAVAAALGGDPGPRTELTPMMPTGMPMTPAGHPGYVQSPGAGMAGDRYDPRAREYARMRLHAAVRSGAIPRYLPAWDADPAAAWRGVSQLMAQGGYFNQPRGVNPHIIAE